MQSTRDWHSAWEQLEAQRIRLAEHADGHESSAATSAFMLNGDAGGTAALTAPRIEPSFPTDVLVPAQTGALIVSMPLTGPQCTPEGGTVVQLAELPKAQPKKRAAAKRKPALRKPRKRKAAARKPAARKSTARKRVSRTAPLVLAPAPPAVVKPEPASPDPALITPLPRSAAPAHWRKSGLLGELSFWLRRRMRGTLNLLAKVKAPPEPAARRRQARIHASDEQADEQELARLRAENDSLRAQLESMRALAEAAK